MNGNLDDCINDARYGEIYLVDYGRPEHYLISSSCLNKLDMYCNLIEGTTLDIVAKIFPSLRRKIAGKGMLSWLDKGDHLILISMVTPPGSYLTVPAILIGEMERVAKIKGYEMIGVHTTLPQEIMETAGWVCMGRQHFPYITKSYIKMVS